MNPKSHQVVIGTILIALTGAAPTLQNTYAVGSSLGNPASQQASPAFLGGGSFGYKIFKRILKLIMESYMEGRFNPGQSEYEIPQLLQGGYPQRGVRGGHDFKYETYSRHPGFQASQEYA
ncbi:hypothetical protein DSO57_1031948 [Entomophthora muscae]|uniref:Uncharacterized protein n=1 Tax=Entomophthora muscae TaxID=34485 RepID=A0ACC2TYT3_9FUNG|nr:hypothetical protein DSO57_1031948 [Entomophthora muscae]